MRLRLTNLTKPYQDVELHLISDQMKNPKQWLLLDKDDTIHGLGEKPGRNPRPGLTDFLRRQSAQRMVGVLSNASTDASRMHLGEENIALMDGVWSTQQGSPLYTKGHGDDLLLVLDGHLVYRKDVAEISEATRLEIQRLRTIAEERDEMDLHRELKIHFFVRELHYQLKSKVRNAGELGKIGEDELKEDILRAMRSFSGNPSSPFLSKFTEGEWNDEDVTRKIIELSFALFPSGNLDNNQSWDLIDPLRSRLKAHRDSTNHEEALDIYLKRAYSPWTFKENGTPVEKDNQYFNPYSHSRSMRKDLHAWRLHTSGPEHSELDVIMIGDTHDATEMGGGVQDSDIESPFLVVPNAETWILDGSYETLANRLFGSGEGAKTAFHQTMGETRPTRRKTHLVEASEIQISGATFILGKSKKGGMLAFQKTPGLIKQLRAELN